MNKRYNIKYWKNRRKYRILSHAYICITSNREKLFSEVLNWSIYKIVGKEVHNVVWKSKVSRNQSKHTVVQRITQYQILLH